jgi:hypothetical protein
MIFQQEDNPLIFCGSIIFFIICLFFFGGVGMNNIKDTVAMPDNIYTFSAHKIWGWGSAAVHRQIVRCRLGQKGRRGQLTCIRE